ncbi:MAG: CRTAC1 family protein [Acidobacteria bacterium]|nr:MAG: CRTAC1 family protein [Acidobacteriota bacterium]
MILTGRGMFHPMSGHGRRREFMTIERRRPIGWPRLLWALLIAGIIIFPGRGESNRASTSVSFRDVSARLDFVHRTEGGEGLAGAAWFDYNNDGLLDVYLTNGIGHANGLFRNNGDGTFTNVSQRAGVENGLGSSGVVAGDMDNDGYVDLFLTGEGGILGSQQSPVKLYHNNGDGTFTDVTEASGLTGPETAWSAALADIDGDGFLDLFIASPGRALQEQHHNALYHNNGDLTFTDISASSGVNTARGGCVASFTDYDGDGRVDLLVGDCADIYARPTPIELFRNNGDLTFTEVTERAGLDPGGFWMGLAIGDYDNDGDMDIFATNFGTSKRWFGRFFLHALYVNNGDGTFTDVGEQAGVARWEWGWGCSFTDVDNDGDLDLFFAGNFPHEPFDVMSAGRGNPGRLLINEGDGTFRDAADQAIFGLEDEFTSGVAVGDFDGNGFPDILVAVGGFDDRAGHPHLYQNLGNDNAWITLRLVGTMSNRDAIGARVSVTAGGRTQVKEVRAGSSFLSMDSPWLTFGLGEADHIESIGVVWPSGLSEEFEPPPVRQTITLVEGEGLPLTQLRSSDDRPRR